MTSPARAFFIIGTDTGVGKTRVSAALLHAFAARGRSVAGMKPVASGAELRDGREVWDDAEQLRAASTVQAADELTNPYHFTPAIAPHIAAAQAGVVIDSGVISSALQQLARQADVVIVEGVGGFRVPLGERLDTADLAVHLGLPLVLVVGLRLGCINHALLTAEAVAARGLHLAGWVANTLEPDMAALEDNLAALQSRLAAPLLGRVPYAATPPQAARHLRTEVLDDVGTLRI
jgi:dethiobiotin synthetase